ncbi:MAG: MBL fold metallo-hydrolase [Deltaproteobacteria bacterium]|nr:MBL fold metallo-hydrolase [Deltaproteobacteria bacterium]
MTAKRALLLVLILGLMIGCSAAKTAPKQAVQTTLESHGAFLQSMPDDREEFELAQRGLIASEPVVDIRTAEGWPIWEMNCYAFLEPGKPAPDTVHPGLWHHAQRTAMHGLFKVADHIYQVRGYDVSVITFIEGKSGYIVIDPLISAECAKAAKNLFFKHLPPKPIVAVIYTHNHIDHWGGVKGIISDDDVRAGKVRVIAPEGFMRETISENVMAGNAMTRRATYMFGMFLPRGPEGQVGTGIGETASKGTITLIAPTEEITRTGQELIIDGVRFIFQLCPDTEAPVEMNFYLPEFKALCIAEITTAGLHNLLTPRGALVRDGKAWAHHIDEAIDLFGDQTEVFFNCHHWPRWGRENIVHYLKKQRDLYKYIHDQTLHLMNQGYTMNECAEMVQLPESLAKEWYNRDFYGTVNFNVKAVYQRYLGWFDANPANLHPLPPVEASKRYVEFMGGADAVMAKARDYLRKGEYRWVVQVMNHVVFADPANKQARELQADALEQLGYASESPVWRNFYLAGAMELREGVPKNLPGHSVGSLDAMKAMTLDMYFDFLAILIDASKAEGKKITVDWVFSDTKQAYSVTLENSVLNYKAGKRAAAPDATVTLTREVLDDISLKRATFPGRILAGDIKVEGSKRKFLEMLSCLEPSAFWFNIVTP